MKTTCACLTVAVLLVAGSASAGTFKDGPFAGYALAGDVEDPGLALGWQAAYEYSRFASLEMLASWHEDRTREGLSFEVWSVALTGRLGFVPHPSTRIYGGAGVGYYMLRADNQQVRVEANETFPGRIQFAEVQFDKDFGAHLAAGAEVRVTERWEFFGEFRYIFFDTEARVSTALDGIETSMREDVPYNFGMLRLGLNFRF